ncbi:YfcC family protein [Ammoniphilus sp. YIM 78166]|uniref:YfcC family protein n=1 Tax=Ammoniphilus sp. YIM 78166 TaxID=1644106 RepID=UPI00106F2442|nr:YfcC family protein [Ammoniphilus sp. YIM 78166]
MGQPLRKEEVRNVVVTPSKKSWMKLPHVYVILVTMLLVGYLATLLVPQGQFERQVGPMGRPIVVPGTFQYVDVPHLTPFDVMFSIPAGMVQAGEIIFGGLMIGALFAMVERTGLMNLGIRQVVNIFQTKKIWVIPALMIPMGVFTSFTGAMELGLIYAPVLIPLMLRFGYDRFTATAMVLVSTAAGFSVAMTAPATVGLAQTLMNLPLYSGIEYRAIIMSIALLIGILYVWRYARGVERNPAQSYLHGDGLDRDFITEDNSSTEKVSGRQLFAILFLLAGMGIMIYGLLNWKWYFTQIGGWYAFMGIALGFIFKMSPSNIAEVFNEGFRKVLVGVIIIGLSRAISVVLEKGNILDTIVHGITVVVGAAPSELSAIMMLIFQGLFNFLVGSGSGQAMITMPVMSGLSDILGVTRQTAVLAFQFGDGFTNILYPTSFFMAILAIAQVPYSKWLRFIIPLLLMWFALAAVALIVAQSIGWGANL